MRNIAKLITSTTGEKLNSMESSSTVLCRIQFRMVPTNSLLFCPPVALIILTAPYRSGILKYHKILI